MSRLRWLAVLTSVGITLGYGVERARRSAWSMNPAVRDRHATSPFQIPWLGWKDVLSRTWVEIFDDRLLSVAASIAFFAILAIAPGVSVLLSIYGLVGDVSFRPDQLRTTLALSPDGAQQIVIDQAQRLSEHPQEKLSWTLLLSFAVAGWSANAAVKGLFDGLNVIYDEMEKRSFIKFNAISMMVTIGGILLLVCAMIIIAVAPAILLYLPIAAAVEAAITYLRWPIFYVFGAMAIAILYWIGPSRRPPRFIWVIPGALIAAFLWGVLSAAFSWYVARLGNYSAMYGSLATIIVFMTWLWISAAIVLLGAELNAELEHQTAQDTTIGRAKPLGGRGATVADNIGPPIIKE